MTLTKLENIPEFPFEAIWRNKDNDQPVTVTKDLGEKDGRRYFKIKGSKTGVCFDELFVETVDVAFEEDPDVPEKFLPPPQILNIPQEPDIERAILGIILVTESKELFDQVNAELVPKHFYIPSHQIIYQALIDLVERGDSINHLLLTARLRDKKNLDRVGGIAYIAQLIDGLPHKSDLSGEIKRIKDAYQRRHLLRLFQKGIQDSLTGKEDGITILDNFKTDLGKLSNGRHSKTDVLCAADYEPKRVTWLWQGRIPRGMLTILQGMEDIGKTWLCSAIASVISNGGGVEGFNLDGPGNVLWFSAEDPLQESLIAKLVDTEADRTKVFIHNKAFTFDDKGATMVAEQITRFKPTLTIIDPIFAYLQGDGNTEKDTRATTNRLKDLSERFNTAIVLVRHVNKSKGNGDPRSAGSGSIAWNCAVRSVLLAGYDPDDKKKRAITLTKGNLAPETQPIGYSLSTDITTFTGCRFRWTGISDLTAQKILSNPEIDESEREYKKNQRREIEEFLIDVISPGAIAMTEVEKNAEAAGISVSYMKKIRSEMGIKAFPDRTQKPAKWYWTIPPDFNFNGYSNIQQPLFSEPSNGKNDPSKNDKNENLSFLDNSHISQLDKPDFEGKNDIVVLSPERLSQTKNDNVVLAPKNSDKAKKQKQLRKNDKKSDLSSLPEDSEGQNEGQKVTPHCPSCGGLLEKDGSCEYCGQV